MMDRMSASATSGDVYYCVATGGQAVVPFGCGDPGVFTGDAGTKPNVHFSAERIRPLPGCLAAGNGERSIWKVSL
jgi:hypothetical protein